jgi:hypothetical protein
VKLMVEAASFADAALHFEYGNQAAADLHASLAERLSGFGGMAGDASIAEEFAAAYDDAARGALYAIGDLVDAFATCGRLTAATLANHGHAENRSVISGRTVFDGHGGCAGMVAVLPCVLPPALGSDLSGVPSWAGWILDQVEGFVWPDADTDRLRTAASCWRAASSQVDGLSSYCDAAVRNLHTQRSPEIPIAVEVSARLGSRCQAVAEQCEGLARACEEYAGHVDKQRAAVLDLLHDLVRDAVVIQGVGMVLGAFTVGGTAAAAAAVNAARVAAVAPRLLHIISTLRALASSCATPMRLAAASLRDVRLGLAVFRRARVTVASARDAERLARVARLREIVRSPRLFNADDLRGLSPKQIERMLDDWPTKPSRTGEGVVHVDPLHRDRQIRVMEGYLEGNRPDPMTHGPYAVVSQNGTIIKVPLEGNPLL